MNPRGQYDVAIIGGGLSGLAAAVDLAHRGATVVLLEQSSKLGGRCYSFVDTSTGDVVDNGQHLLVGAYRHTLRYLDLIGTRTSLRVERKLSLPFHHRDKGLVAFEMSSLPKPLHVTGAMLKFRLLSLKERRQLLHVGLSLQKWNSSTVERLSAQSVDEWLSGLRQSENAKQCLWFPIAVSVMNEVPEKASALLFARALRSTLFGPAADARILIPTVGQTELYVEAAVQYLAERRGSIRLNTEVRSVLAAGEAVKGIELKAGESLRCGRVISAVPHFRLQQLLPRQMINYPAFSALKRIQSSPIVSVHLWFDQEVMPLAYVGLIGRTMQWVFNRRKIVAAAGRPKGYLTSVASGAHEHIRWTKEKLVERTLRDIGEVFPGVSRARLLHALVVKEKRATFSPTAEAEALRPPTNTPLAHFYLAGDWTATGLPATIEGAIMSGFSAAREALKGL